MNRLPKTIATAAGALIGAASLALACGAAPVRAAAAGSVGGECAAPRPEWIWCDDFETDRTGRYFEFNNAKGAFVRAPGVGTGGSSGMRASFAAGAKDVGSLKIAFGKTPAPYFRPVDAGTTQYRDIYWRVYLRNDSAWTGGGGDKLSRATVLASSQWAQAMIAHVWSGSGANTRILVADPASGTDAEGALKTTRYNDFPNLRWLGVLRSTTPLFVAPALGAWHCVEAHAKLNAAGASDGVLELWVDEKLEAQKSGLNWIGSYSQYGINAVFFENYWNNGSPVAQQRYMDDIVVSTAKIGCHS